MSETPFDLKDAAIAWCPGCGNFGILNVLKTALAELEIAPEKLVMVSGIGQAAKIPQYLKGNFFNGLHGRSLPAAAAIKAANPGLTVIAESGDGCMYGEGGNHFIHSIRRNPDITCLVHNNMIYGLTKGQASPTSLAGFRTPVQVNGVISEPFNPLAVAIALKASFVARAYAKNAEQTKEVLKEAIVHRGFALVDIFQPCVTFNRLNTYQWFGENTYYLDDDHDPTDRAAAFARAIETEKYPLGVLYRAPKREPFEAALGEHLPGGAEPLYQRKPDRERLVKLWESFGI